MSAAHTPGPWHIDLASGYANVWRVRAADDRIVATCEQVSRDAVNAEVNSRLIAAAPDLLALLIELADMEGPQPGTSAWGDKALSAIAKATGVPA